MESSWCSSTAGAYATPPGASRPTPADSTTSATALLAPATSSAPQARRFLDATLRRWSCGQVADVVTLLASEIVTNALLHGRGSVLLAVHRDPTAIRVEVHDGSTRAPVRRHAGGHAETGRGLALVAALSARWGVAPTSDGKTVWFEVAV